MMMIRTDDGYSLVECLIAMALTLMVTGSGLALANRSTIMGQGQPDALDMQERLRIAHQVLFSALMRAGAGMSVSPAEGPLNWSMAPIIPRRIGAQNPDPDLSARTDAITVTFVPETVAQSVTDSALSVASGLAVRVQPNCPVGQTACGFQAGMTALVFDRSAHFDLFSIPRVSGATAELRPHGAGSGYAYAAGAAATEVESHTYYFDRAAKQLRQYDGDQTDVPVADNVSGVSFEYFGDPYPPLNPRPPAGVENCLYDAAGNLIPMPVLAGAVDGLAPLPLSMFTDGPWCGGGTTRFDADLLRIRLVRVTLRVQATAATMRAAAPDVATPGISRESARDLRDLVTTFVVSPRNLMRGR